MLRVILLIIAISTDLFVFMLEKGACLNKLKINSALIHACIIGIVSILMLSLGLNVGHLLQTSVLIEFHQYVSILVLFCISLILFLLTFKKEKFVERYNMNFNYITTIKFAFLTCIDLLLMGISLSAFIFSYIDIILCTFVITFVSSVSALYIGFYNGAAYQKLIGFLGASTYFIIANYQLYMLMC